MSNYFNHLFVRFSIFFRCHSITGLVVDLCIHFCRIIDILLSFKIIFYTF